MALKTRDTWVKSYSQPTEKRWLPEADVTLDVARNNITVQTYHIQFVANSVFCIESFKWSWSSTAIARFAVVKWTSSLAPLRRPGIHCSRNAYWRLAASNKPVMIKWRATLTKTPAKKLPCFFRQITCNKYSQDNIGKNMLMQRYNLYCTNC